MTQFLFIVYNKKNQNLGGKMLNKAHKKERVNITLGSEILKKLNLECVKTSLTKSVIIQLALENYLKGGVVGEQKK